MKKLSYTATYDPPLLHKTLTWKSNSHWKTFDLDCVDENSMLLAKISSAYYSCKRGSQIQFFGDAIGHNSVLMSEFMATGLAMAQYINLMASTTVAAVSTWLCLSCALLSLLLLLLGCLSDLPVGGDLGKVSFFRYFLAFPTLIDVIGQRHSPGYIFKHSFLAGWCDLRV